jgi:hypothetical protein
LGKKTLARMDELLPELKGKTPCCANCARGGNLLPQGLEQAFAGANFRAATGSSLSAFMGGISLPTGLRFLTTAQMATATAVFGFSLNFATILLSDALGLGGRPFTVATTIPPTSLTGPSIVVINAGTFAPARDLLIHELAHAWQSQHAVDPRRFMANSIASQAMADELLGAFGVDASAYYYKPGKSFALYAAEQIACQVEGGVPSILGVIRSLPAGIVHPLNELSLSLPRWEARGPGVVTSC